MAAVKDLVNRLGGLARDALKAGDYGAAAEIARMLEAVSTADSPATPVSGQPSSARQATTKAPSARKRAKTSARGAAKKARPPKRVSPTQKHPYFERDGDKLVKIGWSKKANDEYEHRAPRAAALAVSEHLAAKTRADEVFEIEPLLPVPDGQGGDLPSYQAYLVLAWLRDSGVIEKKGREGYVRVTNPLDGSVFDMMWDQIPERK